VVALVPVLPFAAFLLIFSFLRAPRRAAGYLAIAAIGGSFAIALVTLLQGLGAGPGWRIEQTVEWLALGDAPIDLSATVDPLGAVMLVVVTLVSLLVQIYSLGYMVEHGELDPGFSRFYAYLSLFTASMLGLVLANNFVQLFIFWELVGLCSYLLVGFWYFKPEAAAAAAKAFWTTRFGDLGFLLGILTIFAVVGTFDFGRVEDAVRAGTLGGGALTLAVVLLFCGAIGKSAQVPLHVWLPDAMEGPTPVSALIHAATMVAAGVYMVARLFELFSAAPTAMTVVAWIGGVTAFFAATQGLVMRDVKRVLAYSTVSQLGYMMMALGLGGLAAGTFHLTTHAFFKALLFLGSGSVIHAAGDQDMFRLGGLRRHMPVTAATFAIGGLALGGVFPFAGFWSKDEILLTALDRGQMALLAIGVVTAFLTAFYIGRAFFLTFAGTPRPDWTDPDARHAITAVRRPEPFAGAADPIAAAAYEPHAYQAALAGHTAHAHGARHAHESPWVMTGPLVVLAFLATVAGFFGGPFGRFIAGEAQESPMNLGLAGGTTVLALLGILVAWRWYGVGAFARDPLVALGPIYTLFARKYYVDDLYNWLVGRALIGLARGSAWLDRHVIDGVVNGVGWTTQQVGTLASRTVTGRQPNYALGVFGGVAVLVAALLVFGAPR
jgi:NADH-quinone oxidoreductase subunit L